MKKKFLLAGALLLSVLLIASALYAAGTATVTTSQNDRLRTTEYTVTWSAPSTNAVVPTATIPDVAGFVIGLEVNPGSPAPTSLYDITLLDADGVDVGFGDLLNLSATVSTRVQVYDARWLNSEELTFTLSNNSVTAAAGVFRLTVRR